MRETDKGCQSKAKSYQLDLCSIFSCKISLAKLWPEHHCLVYKIETICCFFAKIFLAAHDSSRQIMYRNNYVVCLESCSVVAGKT